MNLKYLKIPIPVLLILIVLPSFGFTGFEKKQVRAINLEGWWKFSIMHTNNWAELNFDDSDWDEIKVPGEWERQGYNGYNGYGFYRTKVRIDRETAESQMYLVLGYIDDVDEVYFNGELIGSTGSFPPNYNTAYNAKRTYFIPATIIKPDQENIIAVKVFDMTGEGGIVKGDIGIYTQEFPINPDVDLVGMWKFTTRNSKQFIEPEYDDSDWDEIMVPGIWEDQGYRNYDGTAWYRKEFSFDKKNEEEYMVMLAGLINDIDMVYLNGTWIGQTGEDEDFYSSHAGNGQDYYISERAYVFPSELLKNGINVVAIKVVDGQQTGGIYDGPVGIVKQSKFVEYWKKRSHRNRNKNDW
jgi:sialate O-acetylesterase